MPSLPFEDVERTKQPCSAHRMMMQNGCGGEEGMKAWACCSTIALSKVTVPVDEFAKKEASSAWLGEKISTFSATALWCSNVCGEQDLACGSQTYNGRTLRVWLLRNSVISSICVLTVSGISKKWKQAAETMFAAAMSVVVEGSGAVNR